MDFFEAQAEARSRSRTLAWLFGAAVLALVLATYLVARVALLGSVSSWRDLIDPELFAFVAVAVGMLVGGGSWYRIRQLRGGGPSVAAMMGGRRILPNTVDLDERRLLNVVSEMAIASGTPLPAVYVLDAEDGMNAFAAGYTTHDAAIAVTRGMLHGMTRDELQGVVAHEFSHVLNGDMRLNIRLIGLLHGILLLAVIGRGLLQGTGRRSRRGGQAALIGVALLVVGYLGVFLGKVIRAAISREREYLADASAVQFTRNPGGISGALKKIGAHSSRVASHHAEEASHLFFAHGLRSQWVGFLATHPPLNDRIRRIDPAWDGWLVPQVRGRDLAAIGEAAAMPDGGLAAASLFASIGAPAAADLEYAEALLDRMPDVLLEATRSADGARALVLAILLASAEDAGGEHRAGVLEAAGPELTGEVLALSAPVRELGPAARMPLLDLALPALQTLPADAARSFRSAVLRAIQADGSVHMFEYTLAHVLSRSLGPRQGADGPGRVIQSFRPVRHDVAIVLSALARAGASDDAARSAFAAAAARLPSSVGEIHLREDSETTLPAVDEALGRMARTAIGVRRRFLDACSHCVVHDGRVRPPEVELLRAIAESLDCPIPPSASGTGAAPPRTRPEPAMPVVTPNP